MAWRTALYDYIDKPGENGQSMLYFDDDFVLIRDKYPKAMTHLLAIIRDKSIATVADLKPYHAELLLKMRRVSERYVGDYQTRFGFHAVPSMLPLHMHVISQDFDSPCLKTKQHWNSFTTEFFIQLDKVIDTLKQGHIMEIDRPRYEALLKTDLKCHKCGAAVKNMPALRSHLQLKHYITKTLY